jgi:hypothetical protein
MHTPDFDEFRRVLNGLAQTFSKPAPDDLLVQAYWNALKDQTIESVKRQATYHTRYGKFFPKPVELRPRDERAPQKPGADDGRNWMRDYWRTQIVYAMCAELSESFEQFERTLIFNQQQLTDPLRRLLDHCEAQERSSGRTDQLHAHCFAQCKDIARWFNDVRASA